MVCPQNSFMVGDVRALNLWTGHYLEGGRGGLEQKGDGQSFKCREKRGATNICTLIREV